MQHSTFKNSGLYILFSLARWSVKAIMAITGILTLLRCSTGYSEKNGKVTFNGKEITDPSFKVLNDAFAKDSAQAWYKARAFEYADVGSFEAVDEHYAKDKNKVYYCDEYREGQNYYTTKKQTITELKTADPTSFVSIDNGYGKDRNHAWFEGMAFPVKDVHSLQSIDRNFAKDDKQVYLNSRAVDGSDGRSFTLTNDNFARDTNHIYYYAFNGTDKYNIAPLPCDPQTFSIIDDLFSKDKAHVFFLGYTLPSADAATFTVLGSGYSKDQHTVYLQHKQVTGADPASFEVFKENEEFNQDVVYAKDNSGVYVNDQKITGAGRSAFRLLGENYTADAAHVYYKRAIVAGGHPGSFLVYPHAVGNADAEDGAVKYYEGKRVED